MPRYKINEEIYNLPNERVEQFLIQYPNAELIEEIIDEGKSQVTVEEEIAPAVTEQEIVTESQSDLGLSELQPDKLKRFNQGEFKLEEKEEFESFLDLKKQQENKRIADKTLGESIENIQEDLSSLNFDKLDYKQKQYVQDIAQQYLLDSKNPLEDVNISSDQIEQTSRQILEEAKVLRLEEQQRAQAVHDLDITTSFKNAYNNAYLEGITKTAEFYSGDSEAVDIASSAIYNAMFGQENVDKFVEKYKGVRVPLGTTASNISLTEGLGTDELLESIPNFLKQKERNKATLPIIESFKQGEYLKGGAAILGSGLNVLGSVAYGMATLGSGYFFDFAAENFINYNQGLADRKGKTLEKLILDGEANTSVPVGIATTQALAENLGLSKITKGLGPKFLSSTSGTKAAALLGTGLTEASTEMYQGGATKYNDILGETGDSSKAATAFFDHLSSQEGLEEGLQGFFGGSGIKGTGMASKKLLKAVNNLRAPVDSAAIEADIDELAVLQQDLKKARSQVTRQGIEENIKNVKQRLNNRIVKGNSIIPKLTNTEIDEVNNIGDLAELQIKRTNTLNKEYAEGVIPRKEYLAALDGFKSTYIEAKNRIQGIAEEAENRDAAPEVAPVKEKVELTKVKLEKKLEEDLQSLNRDFNENIISEQQYNADFERLTSEYNTETNRIANTAVDLKNNIEGIKETSVKASQDLQQAFDEGVAEGTITKDKDGKNVLTDKPFKAILKTQMPFIKKLSNQVYNAIPQDLRRGTKAQYESNLETELLDVLRTYNRSIPLGAYIQNILPKRAIGATALENISNEQFTKDLESNTVQSIMAEEDSEVAPEIKNINTAKALNIGNDLLTTIKDVAKRALLTTQQKVDATKFKSDIAKTFKDALYTDIKQKLGLKDTKTNKGLTSAIETNPAAFYDAMSVEAMRKARGKGGINPFVEAGFLKDVNGVLEKVSLNKLGVDGILNYITDPNIAKNTRSDRQMHLVEALAVSMGAREAINLLENDTEFRQRFAEQQKLDDQRNIFEKTADKIQNIFQKTFEGSRKDFRENDVNWDVVFKEYGVENINLNDETQRKKFLDKLVSTGLTKLLPASFFRNFNGTSKAKSYNKDGSVANKKIRNRIIVGDYVKILETGKLIKLDEYKKLPKNEKPKLERDYDSHVFFINVNEADAWINGVGIENFAKEKTEYSAIVKTSTSYTKKVNGKPVLAIDFKDKNFVKQEDNKLIALEDIFVTLQDFMLENGELNTERAALVGALLKSSSSWQQHFIRKLSPIGFTLKNNFLAFDLNGKKLFTEEHTLPASAVAKYLFRQAVNGTVKNNFNLIKNNFFQGPLLDVDDNKLSGIGPDGKRFSYKSQTPIGFRLSDNIWARYFNKNTNIQNGGINPNDYILKNGNTIAEEFNVGFDGTVIPDVKKLQQESISEQTEDQVENLIDRAIAKLTELTGTEGTLQTNLGAVPINIVIGGLRATKLAYQGGKALADAIADGYKKVKDYMSAKEWSDFVTKYTKEVRNEKNPAQVKLAILSKKGVAQVQEQSRKTDEALLKEFGIEIEGLTTDEIVDKLNILRKAKIVGSNDKAPKKKARVFDFDDTLAKTNSKVLYTLPDTTTQELTGTGDAFAIRTIIYNEVLNAISKNPNIERLRFSSDAKEPSRVKLYDFITKKLSKDLGWKIDNYETSFLDKPITQDFELVRPKNGGKKIKTKGKYNLTEDEAGNLNTNFVINGKTYDVNINNKDGENKADFEVEFSLNIPGETGSLDATQFAEQYNELQEAGATFDYSEFNQVKDGSKGPLATLAKRFTESKGDRDVFVLTARPAEAAEAIQEFLRSTLGISIPLQNISGLANGKPGAKAMWVAEKVSEGYNDVFFADDSKANVDAVSRMLDNLGVTKRVQQAKESGQRSLEDEMDSLIRGKKRSRIGKILSKYNIYIPPGADDFAGLLKYFQAKGKLGEEQMKWFEENLLTPFAQGINAYTTAKVSLANDFKEVNKRFKNYRSFGIPSKFRKLLSKEVLGGIYTNEQAVRAYLYDKAGEDLGLNKADTQDLIALVEGNAELKAYAEEISKITKLDNGYPPIPEQWLGGSIATDMAVVSNVAQRAEFLQEFTNNKNQIFSDQNMKLIKQIYGNDYADALINILERMQTGKNRKKGKDKEFNSAMNWINQSVGAIMAVNMRSAILQQLSTVNYMNWNFNNPIKMGLAMANVPQFRKDYIKILNSDFLKERRGGMAIEVNLADIADSNPGNIFLRLNKKVLELGFKPTQWGDSNAIAFGGATWYRNRYNELIKEGMSESEADSQAMLELQEVSETAQQSSRPDKISRQQASDIGRIILAFANTPLQYARETRKATLDLVNGRGDWKTNASKIIYYGVAQNLIFTALQQGLFSLLLESDDEDEKEKESKNKKTMYAVNNVVDGVLRGMGYAGAVVSALKNLGMEYYSQKQRRDEGKTVRDSSLRLIQKGLTISPPVSKKIGDIIEGQKFETWRQYKNDPFYQAFAYANYVSGLTNLPVDRLFKKVENLRAASQDSTEAWQSVFLSLGWSPYNVGVEFPARKPKRKASKSSKSSSKSGGSKSSKKSSLNKGLPNGVLGRANNDGTIEIDPKLKGKQKEKVIAHEKKHLADMKSGKLNYDDDFVYWKGNKHKRVGSKIEYNGNQYPNGSGKLPWERAANQVEKQIT